MTLETLMDFFGWMALINIGVLFFSTITTALLRKTSHRIHSALFKITPDELDKMYFKYLAQYKILTLIFTIVPYFALRVMIMT